jgi:hypothetical protein
MNRVLMTVSKAARAEVMTAVLELMKVKEVRSGSPLHLSYL